MAFRSRKVEIQKAYDTENDPYRQFRKELFAAKFKSRVMPLVLNVLQPVIRKALENLKSTGGVGEQGAQVCIDGDACSAG